MFTNRTNTIYNCAHCGSAAYFNSTQQRWLHYGAMPGLSCTDGFLCTEVSPVPVTLPAVHREDPQMALMDYLHGADA